MNSERSAMMPPCRKRDEPDTEDGAVDSKRTKMTEDARIECVRNMVGKLRRNITNQVREELITALKSEIVPKLRAEMRTAVNQHVTNTATWLSRVKDKLMGSLQQFGTELRTQRGLLEEHDRRIDARIQHIVPVVDPVIPIPHDFTVTSNDHGFARMPARDDPTHDEFWEDEENIRIFSEIL